VLAGCGTRASGSRPPDELSERRARLVRDRHWPAGPVNARVCQAAWKRNVGGSRPPLTTVPTCGY